MPTNFDSVICSSGAMWAATTMERQGLGTIPTTGGVTALYICRFAGSLSLVQFVTIDTLAANDTNYVIPTITNKQAGGSSIAMLAPGAVNGTQATGGSAFTAFTKRTLTLNAAPANLVVALGDTLALAATVTGTLGSPITGGAFLLTFAPS